MTKANTTFFDGLFLRGDLPAATPSPYAGYISETISDLAARLTNGEEVGVGYLNVLFQLDEQECKELAAFGATYRPGESFAKDFSGAAIFIPGVGLWACVPLAPNARDAMKFGRELQWAWTNLLRSYCEEGDLDIDPDEVPVDIALLAIDEGPWDLRGIDPRHAYLPHTYAEFSETLRTRALNCNPDALNTAVRFLVEKNFLREAKAPTACDAAHDVPTWLTRYLPLDLVA